MSAHDQMRAMLDELMGTGRDGESSRHRVKFDSSRVCKSFLLACCPHDILSSTRMDLGECPKVHDFALRADYESASKQKDYYYDIDAMEHLEQFIQDCDRRTEIAKKKLKETQDDLTEEATGKADVILKIGEEIGTKLAKAELLGAEGNVEESIALMAAVEQLNKVKSDAEEEFRNSMPSSTYQQQKLRVCEVCGAYLGIHDNDRRLADHFGGKLHIGFIEIREKLQSLAVESRRQARDQERESMLEKRRTEQRDRSRSRSRGRRDRGDRDRDSERGDRRRDRDRERRRTRSRSRDRRRRDSRERDRGDRRRDRDRDRDRRDNGHY